MYISTCRENQGLAREKKLTSAKVETLQEQLASSKAEATSHGKGRDDLARQMTMLKEEATKGASLDRANADLKKQLQDLEAKASEADLHSKQAESALAATTRAKNRIELEKETQITQVTSQLEEQLKLVGNGFFFSSFGRKRAQDTKRVMFFIDTAESLRETIQSMEKTDTTRKDDESKVSDALVTRVQSLENSLAQERRAIQQLTTYAFLFSVIGIAIFSDLCLSFFQERRRI